MKWYSMSFEILCLDSFSPKLQMNSRVQHFNKKWWKLDIFFTAFSAADIISNFHNFGLSVSKKIRHLIFSCTKIIDTTNTTQTMWIIEFQVQHWVRDDCQVFSYNVSHISDRYRSSQEENYNTTCIHSTLIYQFKNK